MARPEQVLHKAVAGFLRVALRPPTLWTTFPSGGGGLIRGAQLKALGLARGWPDLLIMHPAKDGGGPIVIGLELKAKAGRVSPDQKLVMQGFADCRAWYVLARSVDEVESGLCYIGVPLHASVQGSPYGERSAA